nr:universal stress protein [Halobellus inordinatus]
MYNRIVIAVDGSDEAKRAARRGLRLAQGFDATVDALSVVEQKALRLTETANEKAQLRERGEAALTEIEELASEFSQTVNTNLQEGKPAVRISEYADEQDVDLIVVGRQGLTGLSRRLLGGVTERILHRSDVSVLVISGEYNGDEVEADYSRVLITTDGSENAEVAIPQRFRMTGGSETRLSRSIRAQFH